jgi:hypothetical protein
MWLEWMGALRCVGNAASIRNVHPNSPASSARASTISKAVLRNVATILINSFSSTSAGNVLPAGFFLRVVFPVYKAGGKRSQKLAFYDIYFKSSIEIIDELIKAILVNER